MQQDKRRLDRCWLAAACGQDSWLFRKRFGHMCRRCSNGTSTSADIFSLLEANIRYAIADGVCRKVISAECSSMKRNEILLGHCLIYNFNSISYTSHKFHQFRTGRTTGFNESGNVLEVFASPSRWTEEQVLGGTTQYHFLFFYLPLCLLQMDIIW